MTHVSACVVHEVIQRTQSVAFDCVAGPEATSEHFTFVRDLVSTVKLLGSMSNFVEAAGNTYLHSLL